MGTEPTRFKDASRDKLRGGYYTPQGVADAVCRWAIRSRADTVLEPSCGDGAFLRAAARRLTCLCERAVRIGGQVTGVEITPEESQKAAAAFRDATGEDCTVHTGDFFEWAVFGPSRSFDCVVGNPPFIRYQNFPLSARGLAMALMERVGLRPNRLTNIWVPFVVGAVLCLRENGRLAMLLPAELLQVSYAAQLRQFLADSFRRLTIFTCNEMFFDKAEQEVVLLAAEGKLASANSANRCDIAMIETHSVDELLSGELRTERVEQEVKFVQHETEKWLKYFLSAREIELMRSLREHPGVVALGHHATVDVGVVTGKNEFFVLSCEDTERHELTDFVVPLVARSAHLNGAVFGRKEHQTLSREGKRVHLLHLAKHRQDQFPRGLRKFIRAGERSGYHHGYKCRIRNPWYSVPSVWVPDCFVFRQIYDFPRIVVNKARATSTDTIHRLRCSVSPGALAANSYTHLTAASAEIEGRSYGGGVLELEPTEAERILVPKELNGAIPIEDVDRLVRDGRLADVLDHNDREVLEKHLGLSRAECAVLKRVWAKMRDRRRARGRR